MAAKTGQRERNSVKSRTRSRLYSYNKTKQSLAFKMIACIIKLFKYLTKVSFQFLEHKR